MFVYSNPLVVILTPCCFQVQVFFYIGLATKGQEERVCLELQHLLSLLGRNHFLYTITVDFHNTRFGDDIDAFRLEDTCNRLRSFRVFAREKTFWSLNYGDLCAQPS